MKLDLFINDYYKIIKILKENEVTQKGKKYIPISQDDIAEELNCSKAKVCGYLKVLVEKKYVNVISQGKYELTKQANEVYNFIEK